jgi:hypothetical protein
MPELLMTKSAMTPCEVRGLRFAILAFVILSSFVMGISSLMPWWAGPQRATFRRTAGKQFGDCPDFRGAIGVASETDVFAAKMGLSPSGLLAQQSAAADALAAACRQTAQWVAQNLGPQCRAIAQPPLVVAGDLSQADLQRWCRETVFPAARAMSAAYFAAAPNEPITILLFADEDSYRRHAKMLFGDQRVPRCGYYRPHLRTVLVNVSAGCGTLLHELTHALAAFDFPDAPEWLREGLAALHEQAVVRPDGQGLIGQSGPRLATLKAALAAGRLPALRSLINAADFHGPNEQLNYAHARYFCLYMQRQGVLEDCYRRLRAHCADDPRGERAVLAVFPGRTWGELDADFRQFVAEE